MSPITQEQSSLEALAKHYNTDKAVHVEYLRNYEHAFKDLIDKDVKLLELGRADIASNSGGSKTTSKFREVRLYPSHLFITKA